MSNLVDGQGVSFDEYRDQLPKNVSDFPNMEGVFVRKVWTELAGWYHEHFPFCFVCGRQKGDRLIQCHHITGGAGRSHESCNVMMLCARHHEHVNTHQVETGMLLWRKWLIDETNTDWVRLAIIRHRFLPDPIIDQEVQDEFEKNMGDRWPVLSFECPIIRAGE